MDEQVVKLLAHEAGLDKALAEFPEDVAAAAKAATANLQIIQVPADAAIEPWPPMHVGDAR